MRICVLLARGTQTLLQQRLFSTTATQAVNKTALATLRKKTGYTFSNCKKALDQFGDDLASAEKWLRDQAQKEGWAKATKLQDRVVSQGLIGVRYSPEDGTAVLLEVNCETDFVARNAKFHELVNTVAEACSRELQLKAVDGASYHKWSITPELLASFKSSHDKTLGDLTALSIGTLGENIVLRRALLVKINSKECKISGYAHASDSLPTSKCCYLGRYGALVIYRQSPPSSKTNTATEQVAEQAGLLSSEDIGRQLCQHIVGMNPESIGKMDDDVPEVIVPVRKEAVVDTRGEGENDEPVEEVVPVAADDESRLIYQEFLTEPTMTVRDVLEQNNMEVLDFVRFELGGKTQEAEATDSERG
ncbi:Elongation factor Ts, mitochondrial [Hypsibius exemplaris]|uniref:Elongation factor Ts, mitochondrial n=1 Tax=Hypsibius exemplaris TaxID=2072580 RepID=A0A1W0X7Z7_HYPEX|nr:Elongation factor Ts, mitochondrial [Hypsibius exemplaris]